MHADTAAFQTIRGSGCPTELQHRPTRQTLRSPAHLLAHGCQRRCNPRVGCGTTRALLLTRVAATRSVANSAGGNAFSGRHGGDDANLATGQRLRGSSRRWHLHAWHNSCLHEPGGTFSHGRISSLHRELLWARGDSNCGTLRRGWTRCSPRTVVLPMDAVSPRSILPRCIICPSWVHAGLILRALLTTVAPAL